MPADALPLSSARPPALFLDRDGVINVDRGFVADRRDFVWIGGIFDLVRLAIARGYVPVIVTNQSGIGRGLYTVAAYDALTSWMLERFAAERAPIARVYACPYHPDAVIPELRADHPWRKPRPGMLLAAQAELGLDLAGSVMVGNRWTDVGAALAAPVGHAVIVGPLARETPPSAQLASPLVVRCADLPEVTQWLEALPGQVPKA